MTSTHSSLIFSWEVFQQLFPKPAHHLLRSSSSDFKMLRPCLKLEPLIDPTQVLFNAVNVLFLTRVSRPYGKETELTSFVTSPPKPSTSPSRITSKDSSEEIKIETDILFGSQETLPQEVLQAQSHSCSSTPWTMPEPDYPMTSSLPRREDKSNSTAWLTSTRKLLLVTDSLVSTEVS